MLHGNQHTIRPLQVSVLVVANYKHFICYYYDLLTQAAAFFAYGEIASLDSENNFLLLIIQMFKKLKANIANTMWQCVACCKQQDAFAVKHLLLIVAATLVALF